MTSKPLRDERGQLLPGQEPLNPKGRTPIAEGGKPNDPHNLRKYIAEHAHAIITDMVKASAAGDTTASNNLLKFILPTLAAVQVETNTKALPIMRVITAIQDANKEIEAIEKAESEQAASDSETIEQADQTQLPLERTDEQ